MTDGKKFCHKQRMEAENENASTNSRWIMKGCIRCNVIAAKVRGKLNNFLFGLGCWIQGKSLALFLIGTTALLGLCVGLKKTNTETSIENLWVEDGGRLSNELKYLKSVYDNDGINSGTELMIQVVKEKNDNILNVKALKEHLQMMKDVVSMQIYVHQDIWRLSDICQKPSMGTIGDGAIQLDRMIQQITPCLIITPLDCFYEGSHVAGPVEPAFIPILRRSETWKTLDPYGLVNELVKTNVSGIPEIELKKLFKKTGVEKGYLEKPCLAPQSNECPSTSINYRSSELPDVGKIMSGGCKGFASKLMQWSEELIVGGTKRNKKQILRSGEALQSVLYLLNPNDVYEMHKSGKGYSVPGWSLEKAEEVLKAWQRAFTKIVNAKGYRNNSLATNMMAYSSTTFYDLIKNFSQPNITKIITGYMLMLAYAFVTLKRWSNAVYSYGAIGIVGVILVSASVAAALGLSSLLKVNFNAASTQVLPFLALGLGVDDMFLMARTYVNVCESNKFDENEIVGETLRNSGLSVTLTSFTNACAFAMASCIPIPALQAFSRQASLIVVLNWITIMFVFSSALGFDVKRIQTQKYDLFCCSGRNIETPPHSLNTGNILQDIAFINLNRLQNGQSISANASLNAFLGNQSTRLGCSADILGCNTSNVRGRPAQASRQNSRQSPSHEEAPSTSTGWTWENIVKHLSLSYFAEKYFGPFLQHMTTKIVVIFMLAIFLGICAYGAIKVKDGLNVAEMVPSRSVEHSFVLARFKYFSFYQMHAVTKGTFDYANNQKLIYSYHQSFAKIDEVMRDASGKLPAFWLTYFRNWLIDLQNSFDAEWKEGRLSKNGWATNATKEGILGFKLIVLTGDPRRPQDMERLFYARLVDKNGIINTKCFYHYLTAWYNEDSLGYWMSQAGLKPTPPVWYNFHDQRFPANASVHLVPKASAINTALIPFYLNNIRTTEDFVRIIKVIREHCASFETKGLSNFPTGIPFTYWEQYVYLHRYLWTAVGVVLVATLVVLAISFMNLWAALIVVSVLVMNTFELYGIMGLLSIKLSAVPAVTLIISVGVGVEFTVHICLAFIGSQGDRNERMQHALNKMFAPICDGAISTLIGIIVLAGSEFEFIVKYFFHLILAMIIIGLANGLVLLPVLLSFIGPCCEVTHRSVGPSQSNEERTFQRHSDRHSRSTSRAASSSRSTNNIEMSDLDFRDVQLNARDPEQGGRVYSRGWRKSGKSGSVREQNTRRGAGSRQGRRDSFGHVAGPVKKYCKYQHRNCVYDQRLRKCREQLTPVTEVSTPDNSSASSRHLSSASAASKASRPGTPMTVPGRAKRVPSPDYHSDNCDNDDDGVLPGFVPETEGITTLKATATVTLELTSSSSSQPFRVSRMQQTR